MVVTSGGVAVRKSKERELAPSPRNVTRSESKDWKFTGSVGKELSDGSPDFDLSGGPVLV